MEDFDSFYLACLFIFILLFALLGFLFRFRKNLKSKKTYTVILWNAILTVSLIFGVFIVGETYYRFFVDTTDSFALNKISRRWSERHTSYNNLGMRDNVDYQLKVAKGKRRLTILGDSFTAGHGIDDVDNRFGNLLRKKFPNLEVHIIADNGASSLTLFKMLNKLKTIEYQFDMVLLAYCLNDIEYLLEGTKEVNSRIHSFNTGLGYFEKNSYLINMLSFRLFAINDKDYLNYSDFVIEGYTKPDIWQKQKRTLREMNTFLKKINSKLIVLTFPFLQQEMKSYTFKTVHPLIEEFWKSENVPHLDLLTVYEPHMGKSLTVNNFDAHPNEFANELAAEEIHDFFKTIPSN